MFELFFVKNYLKPQRRKFSQSLIALVSVAMISLVVWLILLFLSVTEGIEKSWLHRLTSLNAPVRIIPTEDYYHSYYYQVDSIASSSNFTHKSIGEKLHSLETNPYQKDLDEEPPFYWPAVVQDSSGSPVDLVKEVFHSVDHLQKEYNGLVAEDYEISGGLARFRLMRPESHGSYSQEIGQSFLTQACYVASFAEKSQALQNLVEAPSVDDVNHLLYLSNLDTQASLQDRPDNPGYTTKNSDGILSNILIQEVKTDAASWQIPLQLLPENTPFTAYAKMHEGQLLYWILPHQKAEKKHLTKGICTRKKETLIFQTATDTKTFTHFVPSLFCDEALTFVVLESPTQLDKVHIKGSLQNHSLEGFVSFQNLTLQKILTKTHFNTPPAHTPPWVHFIQGVPVLPENGIIVPNHLRDNHLRIGDTGCFSFGQMTSTMLQEQRVSFNVIGFYNPGVLATGIRCFLAHKDDVHSMALDNHNVSTDPMLTNGIAVWLDDLKRVPEFVSNLQQEFHKRGISSYWKIVPFYTFDFAVDLMKQFQSDRYLFMLVGIIILAVACSNIVSLLLLLVQDKKKEIGILLSLGAKKTSIACIFGLCGAVMGLISCVIGTFLAICTLQNIDQIVAFLNFLEGQQAFHPSFYGTSLPKELSINALFFICFAAPIISLIAGLIPARKACQKEPSALLRSDS